MTAIGYQATASIPRQRRPLLIAGSVAIAIAVTAVGWNVVRHTRVVDDPLAAGDAVFVPVKRSGFDVVVRNQAELQAINNIDLVCSVEGLNTIRSIVPEGTTVRAGDVIAEIDSSEIKRKHQTALLEVKKAQNDFTAAKEQRTIQESKNTADLEAARVELRLAQIDLRTYTEGDYPQKLGEATRNLEMARITLKKQQQHLAQTRPLFEKGFVTQTEMEEAQHKLVTAQNDFEKKTSEYKVLTEYTREKDLADKQNKVAQAEKKVARTEHENAANLSQKIADEQTKEQALHIQKGTLEHWQRQLDACTVKAPAGGMVIYGSSVNTMFYRETPIQAGAKIAEQQLLARLPDTSAMKAVTRVPESSASKLRVDKTNPMRGTVKISSTGETVGASVTSVSILADNTMRWLNPDSKDYPVDLTLDRTPAGLKPGASAQVEIRVQHLDDVLTVPLAALHSIGEDHYAFVREHSRVRPVKVSVGATNDTVAEVQKGLTADQEVLMLQVGQGQRLLDAAGIKPPPEAAQPSPTTLPALPQQPKVAQALGNK
jgi:hypothetical protein